MVVFADSDDESLALDAVNAGARGYLARQKLDPLSVVTVLAGAVASHRAILQLNEARQRDRHMASHDPVTGLANRVLLNDRLSHTLATARRDRKRSALLLVNLDGFKRINDRLGQAVGDGLLREVARRIGACLRKSDTAARLDSDEFAVVLGQLTSELHAIKVADKILETIHAALGFTADASPWR